MTDKELRKLKRSELLEILFFMQKEYEELNKENEALSSKLELLEKQLLEASDNLSEKDLEKVSEIVSTSINTNAANADSISAIVDDTIAKWKLSDKEEQRSSEENMANMFGRFMKEYRSEQASVRTDALSKNDLKNMAAVFDYVLKCNLDKVRKEGTLHRSDLEGISETVIGALEQQRTERGNKRTLTDEDMSYIYSIVKKAVGDRLDK